MTLATPPLPPSIADIQDHVILCTTQTQVGEAMLRTTTGGQQVPWVALDTETMGRDWLRVTRDLAVCQDKDVKKQLKKQLTSYSRQALDHNSNHLAVVQLGFPGDISVVCVMETPAVRTLVTVWLGYLKDMNPVWILQNAKFDLHQLKTHLGVTFHGQKIHDTMINDALLRGYRDSEPSSLIALSNRYITVPDKFKKFDRGVAVSDWWGGLSEEQIVYASVDTLCLPYIAREQAAHIVNANMQEVVSLEAALIPRLVDMEDVGVSFDKEKLDAFITKARVDQDARHVAVREIFGDVNVNSSVQMLAAFARVHGQTPIATRYDKKKGEFVEVPSMDKKAILLSGMLGLPGVREYVRYKEVGKQIGDAVRWLNGGHRFQPSFNQVLARAGDLGKDGGARSGRLSSSPNIQNIPDFMKQFLVADPGCVILDSDYAAIELRMMASLSDCQVLKTVFNDPTRDPHTEMAMRAFRIPKEKIGKKSRERTLAKNCIAEGSPVLTDAGSIPIENVTTNMLVWDGASWVAHAGVICKGVKEIVSHSGLAATPDHNVYTQEGWTVPHGYLASEVCLGQHAVTAGASSEQHYLPTFTTLSSEQAWEILARSNVLCPVSDNDESDRHVGAEGTPVPMSATATPPGSAVLETTCTVHCGEATLHQSELSVLEELRGAWDSDALCIGVRLVPTPDGGLSTSRLYRSGHRPHQQRRPLRTGEPPRSTQATQLVQYATECLGAVRGAACAVFSFVALTQNRLPRLQFIPKLDNTPSFSWVLYREHSCHEPREETVYDIINAGPNHRFTVSGKLVFNCNFGFIFGMGPKRFASQVAEATQGELIISLDEARHFYQTFFDLYPEIGAWHIDQHARASVMGYVTTRAGRRRYYNPEERPLLEESRLRRDFWSPWSGRVVEPLAVYRYNDWRWRNVAFNHPDQGTCADGMKAALNLMYNRGVGQYLFATVHDAASMIVKVDQVERIAKIKHECMVEGMAHYMPDIPVVVEQTAGRCWSSGPASLTDPGLFVIDGDDEWCSYEYQRPLEIA